MKINLLCSASLAAALALAGCCSSTPSAEPGTIKVSAYHTEDFAPDAITWSLSVSIKGQNKDSLVTELKKRVTALTAFADSIGVPKDSLVTQQFSLDKDSGKTVVEVMDTDTNEVIRQIPSEGELAIP